MTDDCRLTPAERAKLAADMDRELTPRPPWAWTGTDASGDVDPPHWWRRPVLPSWHSWFDGEAYLGVTSARTGPDDVKASQRCGCVQCATVASGEGT